MMTPMHGKEDYASEYLEMLECEDERYGGRATPSSRSASSFFQCKTPKVQYFPSTSSSSSSGRGKQSEITESTNHGSSSMMDEHEEGDLARNNHSFNCLEAINSAWVMNYGVLVPSQGSGPYAASPAGLLRAHHHLRGGGGEQYSSSSSLKKLTWSENDNKAALEYEYKGSPPYSLEWGTYWTHD